VVRELGKGAMGVVYLGRDPVIGRLVALKTIRVAAEDDVEQREFNERFLREAQAAGTLSHPNIVTVHDVGEEDETSFIAMEYVEGKNLKQVIREKERLPFERIAEIIAEVAEALDYAHRKGIVHRDVKPANIIITPDGSVKITDFGIAKIETSSLTETGQFLGTPNYMSPEQVTGETVDGRSDLFSLGVVLYELLTKRKPFLGDNVTSISYKIVHESFPPLPSVDKTIPSEFGPILAKALSKDPASRFQRGSELVQALSEVRARQAEYQMIRDLGEMVAQAEKLGPVAPVEAPPASPRPPKPTETTARISAVPPGAPPDVTAPLEALARRRDDLNPQLATSPAVPVVDSSGPDWSLDTDAMRKTPAREPIPREPVPSSPGTLISDLPRPLRKPGGETVGASEGSLSTNPVAVPRPPASPPPDDRGATRAAETPRPGPRTPPRGIPALDTSSLQKPLEAPAASRRPAVPTPPALPGGAGPGPRPPALPQDVSGPLRRPAAPAPAPSGATAPRPLAPPPATQPARPGWPSEETTLGAPPPVPPPRERTAGVRLDVPVSPPRERTAGIRLEPPPARERTGGVRLEVPAAPMAEEKAPILPKTEPLPALPVSGGAEPTAGVMRREVSRRWATVVLGVVFVPALIVLVALFARSRQLVPRGERDVAAAEAAVSERRRLLDEGNRLLSDGKIDEAKAKFLELARLAPESVTAKEALRKTERLLVKKAERDRRNAEVARYVTAARSAQGEGDVPAALASAEAALALEPDHAEALELKKAALDALRNLPKADQRKAEARLRALRAAAPVAPAAPAAGAAVREPAAGPPVQITFRSSFPAGTVFVRMNGTELLRRSFDFGSRSGGLLEASAELPSSSGELRAWVFSADGTVRGYAARRVEPGNAAPKSFVLGLDEGRKLSLAVE